MAFQRRKVKKPYTPPMNIKYQEKKITINTSNVNMNNHNIPFKLLTYKPMIIKHAKPCVLRNHYYNLNLE